MNDEDEEGAKALQVRKGSSPDDAHQLRHWAQVALALRNAGYEPLPTTWFQSYVVNPDRRGPLMA